MGEQSIQVKVAGEVVARLSHPRSIPEGRWEQIAVDLRDEALERTAWLSFRGLLPDKALEAALKGMHEDLNLLEIEPSWQVVRSIAENWPSKRRKPSGHYHYRILELASAVERMARVEIDVPDSYDRKFEDIISLLPTPDFAVIVASTLDDRALVLRERNGLQQSGDQTGEAADSIRIE